MSRQIILGDPMKHKYDFLREIVNQHPLVCRYYILVQFFSGAAQSSLFLEVSHNKEENLESEKPENFRGILGYGRFFQRKSRSNTSVVGSLRSKHKIVVFLHVSNFCLKT